MRDRGDCRYLKLKIGKIYKEGKLMDKSLCETCIYQIREKPSKQQIEFMKSNPKIWFDIRFCSIEGCDGSKYKNKKNKEIK